MNTLTEAGISQRQACRRISTPRATWNRWRKKATSPATAPFQLVRSGTQPHALKAEGRAGAPSAVQLRPLLQQRAAYDQYSPLSAVAAIENAPELHAADRSLNIDQPLRTVDIIVSGPIPGAPHLPKLMKNVTVDEALDSVARTFKGIVMYAICKQPDGKDLFKLDYVYGIH